eukprot:659609-Pyramimonas_sp.AAC.1
MEGGGPPQRLRAWGGGAPPCVHGFGDGSLLRSIEHNRDRVLRDVGAVSSGAGGTTQGSHHRVRGQS